MKTHTLFTVIFIALITSCNNSKSEKQEVATPKIEKDLKSIVGVWERTSFYNYDEDGKVSDSFSSSDSNRHIKIFTPHKVMWCRNISTDSSEWFGYGNYDLKDNELTEHLEYGSLKMNEYIKASPDFVFEIELTDKSFSQIQMDTEGHPLFAENYVRLE